ncbi:MAG: hypothetical protein ACE5RI_10595 [Candidatus Nitrosomaritimum yanchengensis]
MKPLYEDKNLQIFNDKITFKAWCLPWGKKEVKVQHIKKISERKIGTFSGKHRISGTGNFRDWFHFDSERPKKEKAIVLETDFMIYKRLWLTPEKHSQAWKILKNIINKK